MPHQHTLANETQLKSNSPIAMEKEVKKLIFLTSRCGLAENTVILSQILTQNIDKIKKTHLEIINKLLKLDDMQILSIINSCTLSLTPDELMRDIEAKISLLAG